MSIHPRRLLPLRHHQHTPLLGPPVLLLIFGHGHDHVRFHRTQGGRSISSTNIHVYSGISHLRYVWSIVGRS